MCAFEGKRKSAMSHGARTHSCPNVRLSDASDVRRLYSLSLSQLKRHQVFPESHFKPSPFNLRWLYGYNLKAGVINLNTNGSTMLFYSAGNCGVLYNWTKNTMRILQGHKHMVICIACDRHGKWLVTTGSGAENVLIIWDSSDFFPQRTLFNPHGTARLAKVAISADAKYLLTLAYSNEAELSWWIWSEGEPQPHVKVRVDIPHDSILYLEFNPHKSDQFMFMTKNDIWIGHSKKIFKIERGLLVETKDYEIKVQKPEKKLNPDFGRLTCFVIVNETNQILVPTSRGMKI